MTLLIADSFAQKFASIAEANDFARVAFSLSPTQAEMLRRAGYAEWKNADGGIRGVTIY